LETLGGVDVHEQRGIGVHELGVWVDGLERHRDGVKSRSRARVRVEREIDARVRRGRAAI